MPLDSSFSPRVPPLVSVTSSNIYGYDSKEVTINGARVTGGTSGIELDTCPSAAISNVLATDVRGPFPRGQCIQLLHSDHAMLSNFSCINHFNSSWTEDSISIWRSSNVTVAQGLVDGNNSPTGVGVMFEGSETGVTGGLIKDVDAVHQGDGGFCLCHVP